MSNHSENNSIIQKFSKLTNAAGERLLKDESLNFQVRLIPDKSVSPSKFRPDPKSAGHYFAHPTTIRAVKKELFMSGEGFEDLENIIYCTSCKSTLDTQFWHFCPYCEAQIPPQIIV